MALAIFAIWKGALIYYYVHAIISGYILDWPHFNSWAEQSSFVNKQGQRFMKMAIKMFLVFGWIETQRSKFGPIFSNKVPTLKIIVIKICQQSPEGRSYVWRHQKTRSVCVKQALNTRRWLVNALVTWHVSYRIMTL